MGSLISAGFRHGGRLLSEAPGVVSIRRALHRADFRSGYPSDGFSGCFSSFEAALRSAPRGPVGYDHEVMTHFYQGTGGALFAPMEPNHYAALFWLRPLMATARCVFDVGGYVGIACYNFRRYLDYPPGLRWVVYDVPAIVRAGEVIAHREGADLLRFTTDFTQANDTDILLASGSLQYMEEGFLQKKLALLQHPPRHVLIQQTPLHPTRSFVTLQVMGIPGNTVFCAYTVAERTAFVNGFEALGYELVDSWSQPRALDIPFHRECRLECYSGMYFRRE